MDYSPRANLFGYRLKPSSVAKTYQSHMTICHWVAIVMTMEANVESDTVDSVSLL